MSSPNDKWLAEFPHRSLVQQVLIDMVKATQCPQCGQVNCKARRDRAHSMMFITDVYISPRCSFDLSGSKLN